MNTALPSLHRCGALLAINLVFLMVWGFTVLAFVRSVFEKWFAGSTGGTSVSSVEPSPAPPIFKTGSKEKNPDTAKDSRDCPEFDLREQFG